MPSLAQRLKEEGFELGERSGVEKGERIGAQKERQKTVRNMHQNGIPMETIIKVTGLPREKVEELLRTTH